MARVAHLPQRRKSGEPYILHPLAVATICTEEIGLGPTAVAAALLHDVVEDTEVSLEQIHEKFGGHIARMVNGLTKLDSAYNAESPQAENFRKVLGTLVEDVRVVLIKMADRLHNMRTLGAMARHKQLKIAAETSYIYAPLAHRLGLYAIKTEFLDLCMKITEPESYHDIARKIAETKRERNRYINEFIKPLTPHLDSMGVPYKIYGRPKSIYSIWNKIQSKRVPFEEIYDLFAVRVVLDVPPDREKLSCWQAYSIITNVHKPLPERLKDWVTVPKSKVRPVNENGNARSGDLRRTGNTRASAISRMSLSSGWIVCGRLWKTRRAVPWSFWIISGRIISFTRKYLCIPLRATPKYYRKGPLRLILLSAFTRIWAIVVRR